MKELAFFDTETTSLEEGRLIQLAILTSNGSGLSDTYKPPVPIDYEAMAVHHITQAMADQHGEFDDGARTFVRSLFDGRIPVAHNAPFDVAVLAREGVEVKGFICTKKVARRLWPEWPSHKLQYLRYRLGINIAAGVAHDAMADVKVLQAVFEKLHQEAYALSCKCSAEAAALTTDDSVLDLMLDWTNQPTLLHAITFGKHKGRTFEDLAKNERGYLSWLAKQDDIDEDLRHTLGHHRGTLL